MSEAVMALASVTLGEIAEPGLMLCGGDVTVHLKEELEKQKAKQIGRSI